MQTEHVTVGNVHKTIVFACFSNCEVLTTLTPDSGRILSKLHAVQPQGVISFCTGIRVAHVRAHKHTRNCNVQA